MIYLFCDFFIIYKTSLLFSHFQKILCCNIIRAVVPKIVAIVKKHLASFWVHKQKVAVFSSAENTKIYNCRHNQELHIQKRVYHLYFQFPESQVCFYNNWLTLVYLLKIQINPATPGISVRFSHTEQYDSRIWTLRFLKMLNLFLYIVRQQQNVSTQSPESKKNFLCHCTARLQPSMNKKRPDYQNLFL